jgi:hypothetical protein
MLGFLRGISPRKVWVKNGKKSEYHEGILWTIDGI